MNNIGSNSTSMRVFFFKRMPLMEMLTEFPGVVEVREEPPEAPGEEREFVKIRRLMSPTSLQWVTSTQPSRRLRVLLQGGQEAAAAETGPQPPESAGVDQAMALLEQIKTQRAAEAEVDEAVREAQYVGEVTLVLSPPVDPVQLNRFNSGLLEVPGVQVLQSIGSWDGGVSIILLVEESQPLIKALLRIPGVHISMDPSALGPDGSPQGERIDMYLRE